MHGLELLQIYVFVLAGFVGFFTITRVPALLHTPLMSATNAISAISLVGSLVMAGADHGLVRHRARLHRRDVRDHQRGGRLHHHGPHAEDVPAGGEPEGSAVTPPDVLIEAAYLVASLLFILGLRSLTIPDRARRGMQLAALGMLVAIVGTLVHHEIVSYAWILAGLAIGTDHRLPARRVRADDGDAAADRDLAHVRRDRGDARRRRRSTGTSATAPRCRAR